MNQKSRPNFYDPASTPFPGQTCSECRHPAANHVWKNVPKRELIAPYELSARRLVCRRCPSGRRACVYEAETTLMDSP